MPTVTGRDFFSHGYFAVPGGASYNVVTGSPSRELVIVRPGDPASGRLPGTTTVLGHSGGGPAATTGWTAFAVAIRPPQAFIETHRLLAFQAVNRAAVY